MKFSVSNHGDDQRVCYYCPGCKHCHSVPAKRWNWNGDVNRPTLSPSVKHFIPAPHGKNGNDETVCHYHIRDGKIEYCGDCRHSLAGKKVDLPEIEDVDK